MSTPTPPGIDLNVRAMVSALLAEPEPNFVTRYDLVDAVEPNPEEIGEGSNEPPHPYGLNRLHSPPLLRPESPSGPTIIARFEYPSGYVFPPMHVPKPVEPLSMSLRITTAMDRISEAVVSFLAPSILPAIIEYTPEEIIDHLAGQFEAHVIEHTPDDIMDRLDEQFEAHAIATNSAWLERSTPAEPQKLIKVMAVDGTSVLPLTATPKRLKEILRQSGYVLAEDTYQAEIYEALRKLTG